MPQRPFDRQQRFLLPPALDEWVGPAHPARFVALLIDALDPADWQELGIDRRAADRGAPRYAPEALLGVWVYGFMRGIRSARGLEHACGEELAFRWLSGNQLPDHNTLWRFYQAHRAKMRLLLRRTVEIAVTAGLADWALLAIDGTKVRANAAVTRSLDEAELVALLERTDAAIAALEDAQVATEDNGPPALPVELRQAEQLRAEVETALAVVPAKHGPAKANLSDPEARLMKTRQGIVPAYNAQAAVVAVAVAPDQPPGRLITAAEVTTAPQDHGQLLPLAHAAAALSGASATLIVADAGYHDAATIAQCAELGLPVVLPEPPQPGSHRHDRFRRAAFTYDATTDTYRCPAGESLPFRGLKTDRNAPAMRLYRADRASCRDCALRARCTTAPVRTLKVSPSEADLQAHRAWMASDEAQLATHRRRGLIEGVFGTLKERHRGRQMLLRGLANVEAEWRLLATAFNLRTLVRWWQATGTPARLPQGVTG
jgi:transposase